MFEVAVLLPIYVVNSFTLPFLRIADFEVVLPGTIIEHFFYGMGYSDLVAPVFALFPERLVLCDDLAGVVFCQGIGGALVHLDCNSRVFMQLDVDLTRLRHEANVHPGAPLVLGGSVDYAAFAVIKPLLEPQVMGSVQRVHQAREPQSR